MSAARQTIATEISVRGPALHAGVMVEMVLRPAPPSAGIVFRRADLGAEVPARFDRVCETQLGTVIAAVAPAEPHGERAKVGVIEHLMSAIMGVGIDDLLITLDGPEPPILDGSALGYLELIDRAGRKTQGGARQAVRVLKTVEVAHGAAHAALLPPDEGDESWIFDCEIDFPTPVIGRQHFTFRMNEAGFRRDIAPARTFGFLSELEALNKMGLARGASLDNTLAIDGDALVNADKSRFADEFVRHKILDAIGDLALAGAPLIGRFEAVRTGHALNNALLRALFHDPANYQWVAIS